VLSKDLLTKHFRIDEVHKKALSRLGIATVQNLLLHLPQRYEDISSIQAVSSLVKGQDAIVYGQIGGLNTRKSWKSRVPISEGWVEDGTARIRIMWFNQPYIAKMLTDGIYVKVAGKVAGSEGKLYITNPETEKLESLPIDRHDSIFNNTENLDETIYPVYRETKGVTSKWFYHTVQKCFSLGILDVLEDPIPEEILHRYNLPTLKTALQWIHTPKKAEHAESARKRFAFEEVFYIQTTKAKERAQVSVSSSYLIKTDTKHIEEFTKRFPFPLTNAQKKSIDDILKDFSGKHPMSRLLEGDVGSGKTAVAATTCYAVATSRPPEGSRLVASVLLKKSKAANLTGSARRRENDEEGVEIYDDRDVEAPQQSNSNKLTDLEYGNLQVAYMAPTEILAKQHFESFITYFKHLPIQIGLITGSGCMKFPSKSNPEKPTPISRAQLLKWVKNGEIPILIGTHALIYKSVEFKHLAHVIIDEQHRFGTGQRRALAKKDIRMPHLLSMTATPIPRTLALTVYGDLDISLLDEMPKGRKPIITKIFAPSQMEEVYTHVRGELADGRQAYVICPRIDEPDPSKENALQLKSVKQEAERLKKLVFKNSRIDILHSKMTPKEKDTVMEKFLAHKIDVLVATSVVEVGVNVPNATNIIIEGAERFGLAQLHQLRGRVVRGTHQAYCFAVTTKDSTGKSGKTLERLKALMEAKNGFELAEFDLTQRGSGELYGMKQWGLTDLGMEAIKNIKMVEAARKEARGLIEKDFELKNHPLIAEKISTLSKMLHME
jgi:ATP-dependent DNA helicase RecG